MIVGRRPHLRKTIINIITKKLSDEFDLYPGMVEIIDH